MTNFDVLFVINDYQKRYYHSIKQFVVALSGGYAKNHTVDVYFPASGSTVALDEAKFKKFVAKNSNGVPFLSLPFPNSESERKENLKKNKAWDKAWVDERVLECEKFFVVK